MQPVFSAGRECLRPIDSPHRFVHCDTSNGAASYYGASNGHGNNGAASGKTQPETRGPYACQ